MKAARILEYHKPLVLENIAVPDIQADEVLVKVAACGMCRSDVLLVDGFFQTYADIPPPVIPGHEITGTIEKIGSCNCGRVRPQSGQACNRKAIWC